MLTDADGRESPCSGQRNARSTPLPYLRASLNVYARATLLLPTGVALPAPPPAVLIDPGVLLGELVPVLAGRLVHRGPSLQVLSLGHRLQVCRVHAQHAGTPTLDDVIDLHSVRDRPVVELVGVPMGVDVLPTANLEVAVPTFRAGRGTRPQPAVLRLLYLRPEPFSACHGKNSTSGAPRHNRAGCTSSNAGRWSSSGRSPR